MLGTNALAGQPGVARAFTDHGVWTASVREDRWKLIHDFEASTNQLFDLSTDPGEQRDVSSQPEHQTRLLRLLRTLR